MNTICIGSIKQEIINILGLAGINANSPIFLGESNIQHMENKHNSVYHKYKSKIPLIIDAPDYVGINPKDSSIEYVKEFELDNEFVKVAVRVSTNGNYFARSMYVLNNNRVQNFIDKNFLKPIDKS